MDLHDPFRPEGRRRFPRITFLTGVVIVATVVVVGYAVVGIVADVPEDGDPHTRGFPGQGFVWLAAITLIAVASLVDALRHRRTRRPPPTNGQHPDTTAHHP